MYLAYTDGPGGPLRCLHAPVLAAQRYKLKGHRRPTHLRVALTPQEEQLRRLAPGELPADWDRYPHPESTQRLGDAWARAGETLGLAVPSVLAPPEVNVMLNCEHPGFVRLEIDGPEPFPINPRLSPDAPG